MQSNGYSYQNVMKLGFSRKMFEKYPNKKLHENPSSGIRDVPFEQTDGQA